MSSVHVIAMDTHSRTTDICVKTRANGPGRWCRVLTTIRSIREVIEGVRRPRKLVFEEGPLADWLLRNLRAHVDEACVSDPRRNALVARDGDKDDPIDAGKLCDLYIGGFVRTVHHPQSLSRQVCKQTVGLYHERVGHRVAEANKVMGLLKRWGVMARERVFMQSDDRAKILERLGDFPEAQRVRCHIDLLWRSYDEAVEEEEVMHREVVRLAKQEEQVRRWQEVPGIAWIRGLTLLAYLDTPWRFHSKQALWKYLGIGLVREHSGDGLTYVHVDRGSHHVLKGTIIGAAESVIVSKSGVFYGQYERWRAAGLSFKNARRNVARSLAVTLWGMWKNGGVYDERLVGCAAEADGNAKGGMLSRG